MLAACCIPRLRVLPLLLVGSVLLSACFDDDNASSDNAAPTAEIHFPGYVGLTEGDTVLVTGASTDASTITRVRVAGVDATSTDGFATWRAVVPLEPGDNELAVETTDEFSNVDSAAAVLSVRSTVFLRNPLGLALDAAHDRVLVVEAQATLVAIDLVTGVRTLFSVPDEPLINEQFLLPAGIEIDAVNNRALVVDSSDRALLMVDLATGERTVLSRTIVPDATNSFDYPAGLALDKANGRALVVDYNRRALLAVDLETGERSVFSTLGLPQESGNLLAARPVAITLDAARNRALVTIQTFRDQASLLAVDLDSGEAAVLSGPDIPDSSNGLFAPSGVVLDSARSRALLTNSNELVAVDLQSGARTLLSPNTDNVPVSFDPFDAFGPLRAIALEEAGNRALVIDADRDALVAVDLDTGTRTVIAGNGIPDPGTGRTCIQDIALDADNERLLGLCGPLLTSMDLATGARSFLADLSPSDDALPTFELWSDIVLDAANGRALLLERQFGTQSRPLNYRAVAAVDLASGVHSVLSDNATPDALNPLTDPVEGMTLDAANGRALLLNGDRSVLAVDLASGARTVVSDPPSPDAIDPYDYMPAPIPITRFEYDIALDAAHNRALVTGVDCGDVGRCSGEILAVDLDGGIRTILSNADPRYGAELSRPERIALDPARNRALVVDRDLRKLVTVDLESGIRTNFSTLTYPDSDNPLVLPIDIVIDAARGRALVTEGQVAVVAVELETGERVIVSR